MNRIGAGRLAAAVISQALEELKDLTRKLKGNPCRKVEEDINYEIDRLYDFFHSEWFEILCGVGGLDPEYVRRLVEEVIDEI